MSSRIKRLRGRDGERGAAMLLMLSAMAILLALGTTASVMAIDNLGSAGLDRKAAVAQNVSEGGVAQAIAWIQYAGVGALACSPACDPAVGQPDWGQGPNVGGAGPNGTVAPGAPYGHLVELPGGRQYRVWIEAVSPLEPPTTKIGRYTVHSTGKENKAAAATATRTIAVDVTVTPIKLPIGVFAHTVTAGGSGGIHYTSLFSDSCIQGRKFTSFEGADAYYGVPAGAHSADAIVEKQNDQCTKSNSIHASAACNPAYPNDSDKYGADLSSGSTCYNRGTFDGKPWLSTSKETSFEDMAATYGFEVNPQGLSNTDLDSLRTAAQQQGFYFDHTTAIPAVLQSPDAHLTYPHPVLFYELKGSTVGSLVDLKDLTGYSRDVQDPTVVSPPSCQPFGAIVVVLNGNVKLNGGTTMVASVLAPGPYPNGQVQKANGTGKLIGTLYADNIDLRGTADVYLDNCFLQNLSGGLLNVTVDGYREGDR